MNRSEDITGMMQSACGHAKCLRLSALCEQIGRAIASAGELARFGSRHKIPCFVDMDTCLDSSVIKYGLRKAECGCHVLIAAVRQDDVHRH